MITYKEALDIVLANKTKLQKASIPFDKSEGYVLAEDFLADRDFPPFDRVTMDGIAIKYSSFEAGLRSFFIEGIAPAGTEQQTLHDTNKCIEVMTGAILPLGTDTVIRYEDLEINEERVQLSVESLKHRQNIHFKGMDVLKGDVVTTKGDRMTSAEITVAATIGKENILVKKMPRAVVISTGDELVDVKDSPKQHQIRRSNVYGIKSMLKDWGVEVDLLHIRDEKSALKSIISDCLIKYDFLVFTGGVSKGKYDYLPEVFSQLNIKKLFHRVQQRPGKPFWFGVSEQNKQIFALPGNPVSTFACMYVYIRSWLMESMGLPVSYQYVTLNEVVLFKPDLVYFLQVKIENNKDGKLIAHPLSHNGSGDFANLVNADGFVILPQGKNEFLKGEVFPFVPFRKMY